jgi:hypothetical protein
MPSMNASQQPRSGAEHHAPARVVELMMRFVTISGLWYGSDTRGPEPSARALAAAAMKSSGEAISKPAEWCSPIHASSNRAGRDGDSQVAMDGLRRVSSKRERARRSSEGRLIRLSPESCSASEIKAVGHWMGAVFFLMMRA